MPLVLQIGMSVGVKEYPTYILLGAFVSSTQGDGKLF